MKVNVWLDIDTLNFADAVCVLDHLQQVLDDFKGPDKIIQDYTVRFDSREYNSDGWSK